MQRRIVIGVVVAFLAAGGGAFAWWNHKQNLPAPMWVPLPVRGEFSAEECNQTVRELNSRLREPELLRKVAEDIGLAQKWDVGSEREAVQRLSGVVFVRMGDMKSPMGSVPAVHIGVAGKVKDRELSGKIAERLMQDVWKILGVQPPSKKG